MNNETTVLDHFVATFPTVPTALWDSEDLDALRGMPLDSGCGDDCRKAIDSAKSFYDQAVTAWGPEGYSDERIKPIQIAGTSVEICLTFICG